LGDIKRSKRVPIGKDSERSQEKLNVKKRVVVKYC